MGWFWQNPSTPSASTPNPSPASVPNRGDEPTATKPPTPASFSDDDQEVNKFLAMLRGEDSPPKPAPSPWQSRSSSSPPAASAPAQPGGARTERSAESLAMSELLLPSTMSCRDALDYAYHCNSPGGQWSAVYREGEMRSCSELWADFWFCLRVRQFAPDMRAAAVRDHYRDKERRKYGSLDPDTGRLRPSSEDVWRSRPAPVEPGTAFRTPFPPPQDDDAALQRAEMELRRRTREDLGFDQKA